MNLDKTIISNAQQYHNNITISLDINTIYIVLNTDIPITRSNTKFCQAPRPPINHELQTLDKDMFLDKIHIFQNK